MEIKCDDIAAYKRKLDERTVERDEAIAQQAATTEVLQVINASPGDLAPVFDAVVDKAVRLCDADGGALWLVDGDVARPNGGRGGNMPESFYKYVADKPVPVKYLLGRDAQDQPFVHVADLKATPPYQKGIPFFVANVDLGRVRTSLNVPMMEAGAIVGVFTLIRWKVRPFTDKQIAVVQSFAAQAQIAMKNASLMNATREALERQTATADILKVIAGSPSDVQPVFEAIAASANRLIGGFSTEVLRVVDGISYLAAFTPTYPAADEFLKASFPLTVAEFEPIKLALKGELVQISDTETALDARIKNVARARGFRSMLFSPLMSNGTPIGLISVTRKKPGTFTTHHIQLLQTFADQTVIAIENVRLFDELQTRTEDLRGSLQQQTATAEVLRVISHSSGDLQPIFDAMLANATLICEAKFGLMLLVEGEAARCVALHNAPPAFAELRRREPLIRPGPDTAMGRLLRTKQIVHIQDSMAERAYKEGDPVRRANADLAGARTILAVPMLRENEVIGAIGIFHQEVHPFTEKQIELVTNFAAQAVIAIENTRLLNELRQRTKELTASLDELRTAQDRLVQTEKLASLGQLTAGIAHEIKNPLNFVNNFSALSAELIDELNGVLKPATLDDTTREEIDELTQMLKGNLDKVVQHGKRADSIVKNMLLHSREGAGEHRPTDINAIVEESLNLAYHGARAERPCFNITLYRDFASDAGMIDLYPQEITRVFLNLIANGFYAATKRKEAGDETFEPTLSASTRNLGDRVEIRIRDNGTGISTDVKEKMFNPFFTTKPAGEGTGLGLSMSHDIVVKQHGGTIAVDTEPGRFTEFTIVLPRTAAAYA